MSPDPAGLGAVDFTNPQSWNRYSYALNNPLNFMDPSGLCTEEVNGDYYSNGDSECPATPAPAPLDMGYTIYTTAYDFYDSSITGLGLFLDTFASLGGFPGLGFSPALGATGPGPNNGLNPVGPNPCSGANPAGLNYSAINNYRSGPTTALNHIAQNHILSVPGKSTYFGGLGGSFGAVGNMMRLNALTLNFGTLMSPVNARGVAVLTYYSPPGQGTFGPFNLHNGKCWHRPKWSEDAVQHARC